MQTLTPRYKRPYMSFLITNNLFMITSIIVHILSKYKPTLRVTVTFTGGRDGTLGMMIVVLIVAVPITVMYSIYVATEAARSKCLALLVIISEFAAGI